MITNNVAYKIKNNEASKFLEKLERHDKIVRWAGINNDELPTEYIPDDSDLIIVIRDHIITYDNGNGFSHYDNLLLLDYKENIKDRLKSFKL